MKQYLDVNIQEAKKHEKTNKLKQSLAELLASNEINLEKRIQTAGFEAEFSSASKEEKNAASIYFWREEALFVRVEHNRKKIIIDYFWKPKLPITQKEESFWMKLLKMIRNMDRAPFYYQLHVEILSVTKDEWKIKHYAAKGKIYESLQPAIGLDRYLEQQVANSYKRWLSKRPKLLSEELNALAQILLAERSDCNKKDRSNGMITEILKTSSQTPETPGTAA